MVGERASAQSPTHLEALKTASSDAQKASAPTLSASGVTLYFLLGGQTAQGLRGIAHQDWEGWGKTAALMTIKCNSTTAKYQGNWLAVQPKPWSAFPRMQAQFFQTSGLNPSLDAALSQ